MEKDLSASLELAYIVNIYLAIRDKLEYTH